MINLISRIHNTGLSRFFTSVTAGTIYLSISIFLPEKLKNRQQTRDEERKSPAINEDLQNLIAEVMSEVNELSQVEKNKFKFESNYSIKPLCFGSLHFSNQVFMLVPYYLNFSLNQDINLDELRIIFLNDYRISLKKEVWSTVNGLKLIDTLKLSRQAKKFLILREIYAFKTKWLFYNALAIIISLHILLKLQVNFLKKPTSTKFLLTKKLLNVSGFFFVTICLCSFLHLSIQFKRYLDANSQAITKGQYKSHAIEQASRKGEKLNIDKDYYDGAIEVFTKEIKRNKLIKNILSEESSLTSKFFKTRINDKGEIKGWIKPVVPVIPQLDKLISWK